MVFYGKPIMQVLAEIGTSRGWKIRHIQGGLFRGDKNEFKNLISPERLLFVVATSQAYRLDFVMALAKSTNALIGAIGNASKVTGTKQTQIISFRNHFQSFGCSLEATGIMPRSFVIDNPKECKNFFHYGRKKTTVFCGFSSQSLVRVVMVLPYIQTSLSSTRNMQNARKGTNILYRSILAIHYFSISESSTSEPTCS